MSSMTPRSEQLHALIATGAKRKNILMQRMKLSRKSIELARNELRAAGVNVITVQAGKVTWYEIQN